MLCVRASFLKVSYLTCCVFFLPFFFYDFGGIIPSGNADGEAKIGSGPRKVTPRSSRIFTGFWIPSLFFFYVLLRNDRSRSPSSTSTDPKDLVPHLRCSGAFLQRSRERLSPFLVSLLQLLSWNRESMGKYHEKSGSKWLSDFYFLALLTLVPFRHYLSMVFDFSHKNVRE